MSEEKKKAEDYGGSYAVGIKGVELKVPYIAKGAPYGLEEVEAIIKAMEGESFTMSGYVQKFQEEFARFIGCKQAVFVFNCTQAMEIAADIIGIEEGDEVIVPAITFISTALPALQKKAKVVFADLDYDTMNIDPESVKEKISDKTKAIFVTHHCGCPVDMDPILEIAGKRGIKVVEDCAHAPGAEYKGKKPGNLGDCGAFSFHTIKNMTTLGEGGMFTTNNEEWAEAARLHRFVGMWVYPEQEHYWLPYHYDIKPVTEWGTPPSNSSVTEVQAAVGLVQLKKVNEFNERRRKIAFYWNEKFSSIEELHPPIEPPQCKHVYHLYNLYYLKENKRDEFFKILFYKYGIQPMIHYAPLYHFTLFKKLGYENEICPVAEKIYRQKLDLPIYPQLTDAQVEYVAESVIKAVKEIG